MKSIQDHYLDIYYGNIKILIKQFLNILNDLILKLETKLVNE